MGAGDGLERLWEGDALEEEKISTKGLLDPGQPKDKIGGRAVNCDTGAYSETNRKP